MEREEMLKRLEAGEDALELSMEKWEDIVEGTGISFGPKNCALCELYNTEDGCDGCPVQKKTGEDYCNGTPYIAYMDSDEEEEYAEEELEFLKSLRPKPKLEIPFIGFCSEELKLRIRKDYIAKHDHLEILEGENKLVELHISTNFIHIFAGKKQPSTKPDLFIKLRLRR